MRQQRNKDDDDRLRRRKPNLTHSIIKSEKRNWKVGEVIAEREKEVAKAEKTEKAQKVEET